MRALSVSIMGLALASSACTIEGSWHVGSGAPAGPGTPASSAPARPSTPAPAAGPAVTAAQMQTPAGVPTSVFATDTPQLVCAWTVEGVAAGTEIVGSWVAVDTGGAAPPNYRIDQAKLTLDGPTSGTFTLSPPDNGWPRGSFRLEIWLSGKLAKSVPFRIQ